MPVDKELTWPTEKMARMIDVTPRHLQRLALDGIIPKADRGRYRPFEVNHAYIRYLRDRASAPAGSETDLAMERLGKTRAERELLEMELAKERKEVITRGRVFQFLENVVVAVREKILGSSMSDLEKERVLNDLVSLRDADL